MVGPLRSIMGFEPEGVLTRFLKQTPGRLRVVTKGPVSFNSVLVEIDDSGGWAKDILRVEES